MLEHRQVVAQLKYSRMLARPEELYSEPIGLAVHRRGLTLSKH